MNYRARRRRRKVLSSGLHARMISHFVVAILLAVGCTTGGILGYYWISFIAGENYFREFIVVYRQDEQLEPAEVDGRVIERRSYKAEALPETTRWAIILPPLILNNLIIAAVLAFLAIRYSNQLAGPVYRMSTDIRRVLAGETGVRIQLRRGDEMKELAQRLNGLLEALELAEVRARDE